MIQYRICFKDLGQPSKGPLQCKKWYSIKYVFKTNIHLKNHEICRKFRKIGPKSCFKWVTSKDKVLDLDKPYLNTP